MSRSPIPSVVAILALVVAFTACSTHEPARKKNRPRVVITADPELDDSNSLIRFLLYASDVQVEGLVYASSQFHWKGDGKGTKWFVDGREYTRYGLKICPCTSWRWAEDERFIHDAVDAYEKVYPNLKVHDPHYPAPEALRSKIFYGNIEFDGDISKDSPGSDHVKSLILDDKPGPLFLAAWGGHSTIARALKSIQEQHENTPDWNSLRARISKKVILLPSGDQDDTYANYIKPNWPDIEYRQFRGGPNYGYGAQLRASAEDSVFLTTAWMKENVTGRGPLGALYRVWGDGKQMVKDDIFDYFGIAGHTNEELRKMGYIVWLPVLAQGSWLGEGDTGTFMNLLGNGLRAYEEGSYAGWGGRAFDAPVFSFQPENPAALDSTLEGMLSTLGSLSGAAAREAQAHKLPDFFPAAQRDFANRMHWSVTPTYGDANHEPEIVLAGDADRTAAPGDRVELNARVTDPDGDEVAVKWWYFNVGSYPGEVTIDNISPTGASVVIPENAEPGQTIHLVLEASDNGSPTLIRYQRVIITVNAAAGA